MAQNTFDGDMSGIVRFGIFELDADAEQLRKSGRTIRLQPQPFKLLKLLLAEPGRVVTREEIRAALWKGDTFVDFDQGVNFAIKQVREALDDDADRPVYIQTVPKRGYRFLAPVETVGGAKAPRVGGTTELRLHKALWANIVELRLAEENRKTRTRLLIVAAAVAIGVVAALLLVRALL